MEKTPRQLVRIVFWSGIRSNGPKMPIYDQICQFWAKLGCFLAKNPIFGGEGVKLLVFSYQETNKTPHLCWKHWSVRLQSANVLFWPQNLDIWVQKSIICIVIAIFVNGAYNHYNRGYNFPIRTTPKPIFHFEVGVIFRGSPLFLALSGHSHVRGISTLDFGPFSMKLGGTVRAIKKMTQNDNGPSPGRNYRETGVFTLGRKVFFWLSIPELQQFL